MSRPRQRLLLLLSLAGVVTAATASMRQTMSAARLLDGTVDSCVVKFAPLPAPMSTRDVYGVALNFDGALWLYVPGLGTRCLGAAPAQGEWTERVRQQLDRHSTSLRAERLYPRATPISAGEASQELYNGCFVGCLYLLSRLLPTTEPVSDAGALFFSAAAEPGSAESLFDGVGHTLLLVRQGGQWRVWDPATPQEPLALPDSAFRVGGEIDARVLTYARAHGYPTQRVHYFAFSPRAIRQLAPWSAPTVR